MSLPLSVATAYLLVRKRDRPALWLLTPLFALPWFAVGAVPIVLPERFEDAKVERDQARALAEEYRAAQAAVRPEWESPPGD